MTSKYIQSRKFRSYSYLLMVSALFLSQLAIAHTIKTISNKISTQDVVQNIFKTTISITNPNSQTIWTTPGMVELKWVSKNIPIKKTIKFYLSKNDVIVQELGIFKNNNIAIGVKLAKGLKTGNDYRVIGIELFPDNKKSIAKFSTPLFTIKKEARVQITPKKNTPKKAPKLREAFKGRKLKYVKELEVKSENISIVLWDHGRKDGDIVSIYLNGQAIVSKYHLDYHKKSFKVKLDKTKPNDLFLYAHNLGKFPPNTVSIELIDGELVENIILNSDLKSCEAVVINLR